ncbi:MAG: hypothetical protein HQL76_01790 [Magnetococcales bacterium]|nr:hypothetical protein [Magnetococcales bacterium]
MKFSTVVFAGVLFCLSWTLSVWAAPLRTDSAPSLLKTPSEACETCHKAIHGQWRQSAHGKSGSPSTLYQALRRTDGACDACHFPAAREKEIFENDGAIPCVFCHTLESYRHEGKEIGLAAYRTNERVIQGPNGAWMGAKGAVPPGSGDQEPASNPFFHNANPEVFRTAVACQGCHDPKKKGDPNAFPVACQNCHMPVADGFADHATPAGKVLRMVKRGAMLQVQARPDGKDLDIKVRLTNLLPHPFPNGGPFAMGLLRLTLLDSRGAVLWENVAKNKMDQDPKAVLALTGADELGHPAPPKGLVTEPAGDSRLKVGEARTLVYRLRQPDVALVRAEIIILPLAPDWLEKLPEGKRELPKGLLAARSEVRLVSGEAAAP